MLEYYIYVYHDPITDEPFYVGKGSKYRYRSHLKPSLYLNPNKTVNPMFYWKINNIMSKNMMPTIKFPMTNLSEDEALDEEVKLINQYGRRFVDGGILFNIFGERGLNSIKKSPWTEERKQAHKIQCKEMRIFNPSYDELYQMYVTDNMTRKAIAQKHHISDVLVKKRLKEHGIKKDFDLMELNRKKAIKEYWNG